MIETDLPQSYFTSSLPSFWQGGHPYLPARAFRLPAAHGDRTSFHADNRREPQDIYPRTGSFSLPCSA